MRDVLDAAAQAQIEILDEVAPNLAKQYRRLLRLMNQLRDDLKTKDLRDAATRKNLTRRAAMIEEKLATLYAGYEALVAAARA